MRRLAAVVVAAATLFAGSSIALAQSSACPQLNAMLQSLDANPAYRDASQSNDNLMALQADERNAEQAYVRTGCQAAQDMRQPQTPECRGIARQILSERAQISQLQQDAGTGAALGGQRQQIMQQMARYGCTPATSGATFNTNAPPRRNFLQQLFGGPDQEDYGYDGDQQPFDPNQEDLGQQATIRTMCVRLSDGYYWPISYSTTEDYIPQDTATCEAECPNHQVQLYYYANPGQDPTQMVDATGDLYTALPNAFAYRKQFDLGSSCTPNAAPGSVATDGGEGTVSGAFASYGAEAFPLPRPDPRTSPVIAAAAAPTGAMVLPAATATNSSGGIPLPRPRPDGSSPTSSAVGATTGAPASTHPPSTRVVRVGDKLVRLVGPETPYAPQASNPG